MLEREIEFEYADILDATRRSASKDRRHRMSPPKSDALDANIACCMNRGLRSA